MKAGPPWRMAFSGTSTSDLAPREKSITARAECSLEGKVGRGTAAREPRKLEGKRGKRFNQRNMQKSISYLPLLLPPLIVDMLNGDLDLGDERPPAVADLPNSANSNVLRLKWAPGLESSPPEVAALKDRVMPRRSPGAEEFKSVT